MKKISFTAQFAALGLAALTITGCQLESEQGEDGPEILTGQEAEDFINDATGQRTGQVVGETRWAAADCEEELVVEEGATFECEERIFTVEEISEEEVVVSSVYTGGE